MDILKKSIVVVACLLSFKGKSQTFDETLKAFKSSYNNEYNSNYKAAISDLQKVYKADSYELNLRLGWLYYASKDNAKSMEYYQKAIDLRKYSTEARFGFIKPANEAKQYSKAYDKYEEILKIDPYNSVANYWVGVYYYNAKKYDIAAKYFELVVNMNPFDYDGNYMLAWTFLNLGKVNDAKVLFQQALLYKPDDAAAKDGLSKCK